jgi:hypothetical protein
LSFCVWCCEAVAQRDGCNDPTVVCAAPVGGVGVDDVEHGRRLRPTRVCLAAAVPVQAGLALSGGEVLLHSLGIPGGARAKAAAGSISSSSFGSSTGTCVSATQSMPVDATQNVQYQCC